MPVRGKLVGQLDLLSTLTRNKTKQTLPKHACGVLGPLWLHLRTCYRQADRNYLGTYLGKQLKVVQIWGGGKRQTFRY